MEGTLASYQSRFVVGSEKIRNCALPVGSVKLSVSTVRCLKRFVWLLLSAKDYQTLFVFEFQL